IPSFALVHGLRPHAPLSHMRPPCPAPPFPFTTLFRSCPAPAAGIASALPSLSPPPASAGSLHRSPWLRAPSASQHRAGPLRDLAPTSSPARAPAAGISANPPPPSPPA